MNKIVPLKLFASCGGAFSVITAAQAEKPNVIIILVDDMGYPDVVTDLAARWEDWAIRCKALPKGQRTENSYD